MRNKKIKIGLGVLTVLSTPIIVNEVVQVNVQAGYKGAYFYDGSKLANWWYDDGKDWYFFKNGKKLTGYGKDNAGEHYFASGKYANWWYDDGKDWYFFKNGKKLTGYGKDNAGEHYFVNGKYANGTYNGKRYVKGKEVNNKTTSTRGYRSGIYYVDGKPANWWYDDGKDWYFFKNGKKLTGYGKDNAGEHYFANGKYANWWYDDGKDWYYFKDGKKYTGYGRDSAGEHQFLNGKYAQKLNSYSGYYKVKGLYIPVYDANGKILSHVSQGTVLFRDSRATSNGRIPVQVAGLTGYVNPSQVQSVNENTTFIPDYVSDGKYVYHRYSKYSKVKVAYHNPNMVVGKAYYSADGVNFGTFKLQHPFQFNNLKSKTNYSAADLNRLYNLMGASNSMLAGRGATFKEAERRYGVNALYLVAHSALESAWGKSNIAKRKNNFFGIAAYDSNPFNSAKRFDNVDAGILGAARWISEKYLTNGRYPAHGAYLGNKAGGMNVNYATAPYWGESIASIMFEANERLGRKDK
ncbi:glucosaminidase domain-containing protein [Gemella bergeri]